MVYRDYHPRRTAFRTLRALLVGAGSVLMAAAPADAAPAADSRIEAPAADSLTKAPADDWRSEAPSADRPTKTGADAAVRHTRLTRSSPAKDTSLSGPPATITLWFTKPVQLKLTRLMLKDSRGVAVVLDAPAFVDASQTSVAASLRGTAAPGAYTVTWALRERYVFMVFFREGYEVP